MGAGGLATCNGCGMKYTQERMQEKIQEVRGASKGATSTTAGPSMENLRELAGHALDSGNLYEAETYASRIIEADPRDYRAWIVKGQAAGWQSSLREMRILEAANCFAKAVELAPDAEREQVEDHVSDQIGRLATAIINMRSGIYVQYPEPEQAEPFEGDLRRIIEAVTSLLGRSGTRVEGVWEDIATQINQAVVKAWTDVIQPEYTNDQHPSDWDMQRFIQRIHAAIDLTQLSIGLSDDDDVKDIARYKNLIVYAESRRDAKSYEWGMNGYVVNKTLTAEAKAINNKLISEWKDKIRTIETQEVKRKKEAEVREAERRRDEYWSTRQEERQGLEVEENQLSQRLSHLQIRADDFSGRDELPGLTQQLASLRANLDATSRLKRAERKELQSQIDALEERRSEITRAQVAARQGVAAELTDVESRLKAVQTELTKPR